MKHIFAPLRDPKRCGYGLLWAALAVLLGACARPLADSTQLAAERTGQAVVGYERSSYVYPVAVPGSNRHVTIVTREPVNRPLTYEDYLAWEATGKVPE